MRLDMSVGAEQDDFVRMETFGNLPRKKSRIAESGMFGEG
jgi:hypothetical protein